VVVQFIDDHRDRFGVEPICRVLTEHAVPIAPSKNRPASARAVKDAQLVIEIERVFWDRKLGRGISGARKIWRLLRREGIVVARCTVERLMRQQGLRGVRRGKQFVTTRPDNAATRPPDHVQRCFRADRPNELWVVDFTYVPTWSGMAFTAFVTDVFSRRIVGWRTMNRMPTDLPLDALEMALWVRERADQDVPESFNIQMPELNTLLCATRSDSPTSARSPRLEPSVIATIVSLFLPGSARIR
jgi:putative transposase